MYCNPDCAKKSWKQHAAAGCKYIQEKLSLWDLYKEQKAATDENSAREALLGTIVGSLTYKDHIKDISSCELALDQKS